MEKKEEFSRSATRLHRLATEKSPYLLQHADNPVDWYPWGEEAFDKARREDKPVFLSIGYSTCHWCHVMAHESFADEEVAAALNRAFVSIKVDREERPDIDHVYMTLCQLMTGSGGWPLTLLLTPEKKPFFAATYLPKSARFGRAGLLEIVARVEAMWRSDRARLVLSADRAETVLQTMAADSAAGELGQAELVRAYDELSASFDSRWGGFEPAPKFPMPHRLMFLLRHWRRTGEVKALDMVETTLAKMRRGGIFDQVGFGFHRYSTDRQWLLPHFEKMLYDQALLALVYLEAHQATRKPDYAETAREIFAYVLRDLTDPAGGFYSAEDADSEGEEGKFYFWSLPALQNALGPEDAVWAARAFAAEAGGNFREEASGRQTGDNILHLAQSVEEMAAREGISAADWRRRREGVRQRLWTTRGQRIRPHRDDKILTDWNGLMIAALAKGAQALDEPAYAQAAAKAADFILDNMTNQRGRLRHRFRDGQAAIGAYLDDYAFFLWGLLELYEATFSVQRLRQALRLAGEMCALFWDDRQGGFFFTAHDAESLLVRRKDLYDGAVPAGNSVAMLALLRLAALTGSAEWAEKADRLLRAFAGRVRQSPAHFTMFLCALDLAQGPPMEIVIAGDIQQEDTRRLLRAVQSRFLPNKSLLLRPAAEERPEIVELAGFTVGMRRHDGQAAAYICRGQQCQHPTTDVSEMLKRLGVTVDQKI